MPIMNAQQVSQDYDHASLVVKYHDKKSVFTGNSFRCP